MTIEIIYNHHTTRAEMEELFRAAEEPRYVHCAHIFGFETARRRGANGKWCLNSVGAPGEFCYHHRPKEETTVR